MRCFFFVFRRLPFVVQAYYFLAQKGNDYCNEFGSGFVYPLKYQCELRIL